MPLGLTTGKRNIKDGRDFDNLFPQREQVNKNYRVLHKEGDVYQTVKQIANIIRQDAWQVEKIAHRLRGRTRQETLKNIHDFMIQYLQYDTEEGEKLRSPARTWWDGQHGGDPQHGGDGVDCDDMTIFSGAILHTLNIPFYIKIVRIDQDEFQHVYIIVPREGEQLSGKDYYTLDGVIHNFDSEKPYKQEATFNQNGDKMKIEYLGDPGQQKPENQPCATCFSGTENWLKYYYSLPLDKDAKNYTDQEIKKWFDDLLADVRSNSELVKVLIHPDDAIQMIEAFLMKYDDPYERYDAVKKWAAFEEKNLIDNRFWKILLWYYNGEASFHDVIEESYVWVAEKLNQNPDLIDPAVKNDSLGFFNPIYYERKKQIEWFCPPHVALGDNNPGAYAGRTMVKLVRNGEKKNKWFKKGAMITIVGSHEGYYDGMWEVKDWIGYNQKGIGWADRAMGDQNIEYFCIDKAPKEPTYHAGFPESWYELHTEMREDIHPDCLKPPFLIKRTNPNPPPPFINEQWRPELGEPMPEACNWEHEVKFWRLKPEYRDQPRPIPKLIIPPSETLTFKDILWGLPKMAIMTLIREFNFANIGTRYIIGEVGYEVAKEAGISKADWRDASWYTNGSSKNMAEKWGSKFSGRYEDLKEACWSYKGKKRKSLIDKLKKHPNFNYYRYMRFWSMEPAAQYDPPPEQQILSGAPALGDLQETTAPELYSADLFDTDTGLGAVDIVALLAAAGPIIDMLLKVLKMGGVEISEECMNQFTNFAGESEEEMQQNPNYTKLAQCGSEIAGSVQERLDQWLANNQSSGGNNPPGGNNQPGGGNNQWGGGNNQNNPDDPGRASIVTGETVAAVLGIGALTAGAAMLFTGKKKDKP